jgi:hypothetical protein
MTARRLAWTLFGTVLILVVTGPASLPLSRDGALIYALAFAAVLVSTALVGAVVASRIPDNAVGWVLLAMGVGLGVSSTGTAYGALGLLTEHGPLPYDDLAVWLGEWMFVPAVYGGVASLLYLFPDGHFLSHRWRWAGIVSGVIVLAATAADAFAPGALEDVPIENPVAASGWLADLVQTIQGPVNVLALPLFGCAIASLVVRFRRSTGIARQQLKWISTALILVGLSLGLTAGLPVFGSATFFLALFALAAMPVATGVAMLRYRLYDIDVVINRALVYGALTAVLASVYLGAVLLLGFVLNPLVGGSGLSIAASTLTVAALFRPARARVQETVDRRFFRRKYDASRTLDRFGSHLRDRVDLTDIGSDLLAVVTETVQPRHVSLWLRGRESQP